jgi:hypothetical protein
LAFVNGGSCDVRLCGKHISREIPKTKTADPNQLLGGSDYAGVEIETSIAEVAFHKRRFLRDGRITGTYTFDYVDFLADFSGDFHSLDPFEIEACLQPEPVPQCYGPSQSLASALLYAGSNGIVYSSVRHASGTCIACFRPALVYHPRRGQQYRLMLDPATDAVNSEMVARA